MPLPYGVQAPVARSCSMTPAAPIPPAEPNPPPTTRCWASMAVNALTGRFVPPGVDQLPSGAVTCQVARFEAANPSPGGLVHDSTPRGVERPADVEVVVEHLQGADHPGSPDCVTPGSRE